MNRPSVTPFFVPTTSSPFFMNPQEETGLPPPSQPMWVPFPGSKRKAVDSFTTNDECGPAPKQFAIDDEAAAYVLKDGYLIQDGGDRSPEDWEDATPILTLPQMPPTQEAMDAETINEAAPTWNKQAGVHQNFEELRNDGKKLHENERLPKSVNSCMDTKVNDLKDSPKLYFFEGLKDALSESRNEDSGGLPRSLVIQTQKDTSMAIVLWKPRAGTTRSFLPVDPTTCPVTKDLRSKELKEPIRGKREEDAEDKEMDISV